MSAINITVGSATFNLPDMSAIKIHSVYYGEENKKDNIKVLSCESGERWSYQKDVFTELTIPDMTGMNDEEFFQFMTSTEITLDLDIVKAIQMYYTASKDKWERETLHNHILEY